MDSDMIRLGAIVEVSRKGTFARKGYVSSVLDVSDNRCVSVFYNDSHLPKSETFVFEGDGWFNRDLYQTVGYLLAPLNQIRPVPPASPSFDVSKEEGNAQSAGEVDLLL